MHEISGPRHKPALSAAMKDSQRLFRQQDARNFHLS
jgi:hypothetical protein